LHFEVARCTLREKEQAEPLSQLDVTWKWSDSARSPYSGGLQESWISSTTK
jgi:hypothetical protein